LCLYGIKITGSFNGGTHTAVFTRIYWGNLSEERFPLTAAVPSVSYADISPYCGESPQPPFQRLYYGFFRDGTRFNTKTKSATFFSSANFVPSRKKLKIRL